MSITFGPYVAGGPNTPGWLWPAACDQNPSRFLVDLDDRTAARVLLEIGLGSTAWPDEPLPIEEFGRCVAWGLRRLARSHSIRDAETATALCGRQANDLTERLLDLARLIERAKAVGATHIDWS